MCRIINRLLIAGIALAQTSALTGAAAPQSQREILPDSMSVWNKADFVIKAEAEGRIDHDGKLTASGKTRFSQGIIMHSDGPEEPDTVSAWRRVKMVKGADFPLYLKDAERGDGEAMRLTAICYQTGTGVDKDLRKAWEWYGKSAAKGNTEAQYDIGTLYRDGIGTKQNFQESAYWFRKAASNGHSLAMVNIARQFAEGKGVLPDLRIAAENYWRAAERGIDEGAYQLAVMLRDGKGLPQDLQRSLKYFEQASKNNYKDSAIEASKLRAAGIKLPEPSKKAVRKKTLASHKASSGKRRPRGSRR